MTGEASTPRSPFALRVLVATDLREVADEALKQASALAGPRGTLAVVHVLPSLQAISMLFPQRHAQDAIDGVGLTAQAMEAVRARVHRICDRDAKIFIAEGTAYAEIARTAEAWNADVVVVGSHGHSGLARVLGSVAEGVVRYAHCRVLVARSKSTRGCVLAATDLSAAALVSVLAADDEAKRRGVALHVAYAIDFLQMDSFSLFGLANPATYSPSDLRDPAHQRLTEMIARAGIEAQSTVLDGPASAAIVQYAEELGAELVVVGAHGWTGLARLLLGSVAEKIVRATTCSTLVVRTESARRPSRS